MKIIIFIILLISGISFAQDLLYINSTYDIDKIKKENTGKVLMINLWASWCKPCVEEFPDLIKLHNNYKNKDFKLILISLDFKEEIQTKLMPLLKKNNVDFTTYLLDIDSPDEIINYFNNEWGGGIPSSIIYNKSGELKSFILGNHDYEFFEKEIKKLI